MNQKQTADLQEKLATQSKRGIGAVFGWVLFGAMAIYQGWASGDNKLVIDAILFFGVAGLTWNSVKLNATVSGILGELMSQSEKASKPDET